MWQTGFKKTGLEEGRPVRNPAAIDQALARDTYQIVTRTVGSGLRLLLGLK